MPPQHSGWFWSPYTLGNRKAPNAWPFALDSVLALDCVSKKSLSLHLCKYIHTYISLLPTSLRLSLSFSLPLPLPLRAFACLSISLSLCDSSDLSSCASLAFWYLFSWPVILADELVCNKIQEGDSPQNKDEGVWSLSLIVSKDHSLRSSTGDLVMLACDSDSNQKETSERVGLRALFL